MNRFEEWGQISGAEIIGVGFEKKTGGIGAHVIAIADDYLVDPSIDQATDLDHGIVPPGVLYGQIDPRFVAHALPLMRMDVDGLFIEYSHHPNPPNIKQLPEWRLNKQTGEAVDRILVNMRTAG